MLPNITFQTVKFGAGNVCIEASLSPDVLKVAEQQAERLGSLNNSIEGGAGNAAGFVGEMMVAAYCGVLPSWAVSDVPSYQFDITATYQDITDLSLEVKTKRTTTAPRPQYEASIASCNTSQKCDWYVFTRVLIKNDGEKNLQPRGWILGYMPRYDYYQKATFLKKGDFDPSNRFYVKHDCYNLPYSELFPMSDIKEMKNE